MATPGPPRLLRPVTARVGRIDPAPEPCVGDEKPTRCRRAISFMEDSMGQKARIDLVLDCANPSTLAAFWREALDYREYFTDTSFVVLVPKHGLASPLVLQGVPEPKAGKNRMHLDIVVDDIEPEIARLQALGAQRLDDGVHSFGDTRWVRMADPEHNEFCVCTGVEW
jgi:hypothetical protein